MNDQDTKPWDRQPGEPAKAWTAFVTYRGMGVGNRSLAKLGQILGGKTRQNYEPLSAKWNWQERCRLYDIDQDRTAQATQKEMLIDMRRRQMQLGKLCQALAGTIVKKLLEKEQQARKKGTSLKPRDAATLLEVGAKLERLNAGEATERVDTNVVGALAPAELSEAMKDREFREGLDALAASRERLASQPGVDGVLLDEGKVEES